MAPNGRNCRGVAAERDDHGVCVWRAEPIDEDRAQGRRYGEAEFYVFADAGRQHHENDARGLELLGLRLRRASRVTAHMA